jgi:hypothetical protein
LRAIRDENLTGMPNAAMMSALEPRDRPAAMEYTAAVPGVATTTRVVSEKAMLTEGFIPAQRLNDALFTWHCG